MAIYIAFVWLQTLQPKNEYEIEKNPICPWGGCDPQKLTQTLIHCPDSHIMDKYF